MAKIAITIDYEFDWGGRIKSSYAIEKTLENVLDIFERNGAKATFFISAETVKKTKESILKIKKFGHEIASHGVDHNINYDRLDKQDIDKEIGDSKKILEDVTSGSIYGFRTPQFRKNRYTEELLLKHGYLYDSSSVETDFLDRYKKNQFEYGKIKNFPVSTIYGKIPAGLKWINLFGSSIKSSSEVKVVYLHLFDLLSMKEIYSLYDKNFIKGSVLLFYLSRRGRIVKTFENISKKSNSLISFLNEKGQ